MLGNGKAGGVIWDGGFVVGLREECLVLGMGMVDSGDREWMGGIGEVVAEWWMECDFFVTMWDEGA